MPVSSIDANDPLWFKDAVIYELHIKAFMDSNADGMGDFKGLNERLDYLQDLGVTTIWLLPFYPSPQRDGGYDISDYYSINPDYGTIKQFRRFLRRAHKRGLRVITELVINHTSDQHPWFQRARHAPPGSTYRDYYVWSDTTEKYQDVRIIFQDFESSNWSWDPVAGAYYWHRFYSHQPDLNYDNPAVQEEIFRIIDYWVDMGVDGFRLDAVPYLYERDGTNCENLPPTHDFLKELRAHVDLKHKGILLLAEANMWPEDSAAYFGDGDECHMNYHFPIMPRMFMSLKLEDRYPIIDIIDQTPDIPGNCQWAMFLRNHDELTLEMVTDEERDYMYRAYNKDALSRINLGIRHRLAPLLDNHRQKIELMNCLLFSMPGTPVIYYGDEIGMGDNVYLGDRDGVRTPMQWSPDRNAGFSMAPPQRLYLPLINDPEYHFQTVNVETQQNNSSSLLWWMKRMIGIRKRYKAFGRGDIQFLSPDNAKVLAFTRTYEEEHLLVLANLSRHPQVVDLELPGYEHFVPVEVFGQTPFPAIERGTNRFTLGPHGYLWFHLQSEQHNESSERAPAEVEWEPEKWLQLAKGKGAILLENTILPAFLALNERYKLNVRTLDGIHIEQARTVNYEGGSALLLVLKGTYTQGFPEWYFLPLALGLGDPRRRSSAPPSASIVALLKGADQQGFLFEATESQRFNYYLLQHLVQGGRSPRDFRFVRQQPDEVDASALESTPRVIKTSGHNLSLAFGESFFLKVFRRLEPSLNPDLEINRYGGGNGMPVPGYLGHFQYNYPQGEPFTIALLQPYVKNQGSAWQYFFDVSRRYIERMQTAPVSLPSEAIETGAPLEMSWRELIGDMPLDRAALLGRTVARFHSGLIDPASKAFRPEPFSLHYQRSLYSAMRSQVRYSFQELRRLGRELDGADALLQQKKALLDRMKSIYAHKMEAVKIRIHGDLHLDKVLFTGRDFCLFDFEDERISSYSEQRLKKSPVRDLASLICSLHYAALAAPYTLSNPDDPQWDDMLHWAELWFEGMKSAFLFGYQPASRESKLTPGSPADYQVLLDTFVLERHLYELAYELKNDRGWAQLPLSGLLRKL